MATLLRAMLVVGALLPSLAAAEARWVALPDDPTHPGAKNWLDSSSIVRKGDIVELALRSDFDSPQKSPAPPHSSFRSVKTTLEANCETRMWRVLLAELYSEPGAAGTVVFRMDSPTDFEKPRREHAQRFLEVLCSGETEFLTPATGAAETGK